MSDVSIPQVRWHRSAFFCLRKPIQTEMKQPFVALGLNPERDIWSMRRPTKNSAKIHPNSGPELSCNLEGPHCRAIGRGMLWMTHR